MHVIKTGSVKTYIKGTAGCRFRHYRIRYGQRPVGAVIAFLLLICLSGCTGMPPVSTDAPFYCAVADVRWHTLYPGIEVADLYDSRLPLIAHAVKIDLRNPSVAVVVSEPDLFKNTEGCVRGETTLSFALRHNTIVAFNAAPFKTNSVLFGKYRTVVGIHIADFRRMSMPNIRYGALLFYADGKAGIIDSQSESALPANVQYAVSGFWTILRDGSVLPQKLQRRDSRTAVGVADGGKKLFIVAVEGENKRKSQGLSYEETAVLMQALGASDALQLDGGSSGTLVLQENGTQRIIAPSIGWHPLIRVATSAGIIYTGRPIPMQE